MRLDTTVCSTVRRRRGYWVDAGAGTGVAIRAAGDAEELGVGGAAGACGPAAGAAGVAEEAK